MYTYKQFKEYYFKHNRCINDFQKRKNLLNETQLKSRYEKYIKSQEKKFEKNYSDSKWEETKIKLSMNRCSLVEFLKKHGLFTDLNYLKHKAGYLINIIDPAHIFGKGNYPHMKYDIDNIISLNRHSHSMLDQMRDPLDGDQITSEEIQNWWKILIGEERYNQLLERSKNEYSR